MEPAEEWAIKIQQTTGRKDAVVCWRRREESFLFWRVSALAHSPAQVRPLTDSFIITISADALRTRERETKYNEMLYSDGEIDWPSLFFSLASS